MEDVRIVKLDVLALTTTIALLELSAREVKFKSRILNRMETGQCRLQSLRGDVCNQQKVCDFQWSEGYCIDGICQGNVTEGSFCSTSTDCEDGFYCPSTDVCTKALADGESCRLDEECQSGYCLPRWNEPKEKICSVIYFVLYLQMVV